MNTLNGNCLPYLSVTNTVKTGLNSERVLFILFSSVDIQWVFNVTSISSAPLLPMTSKSVTKFRSGLKSLWSAYEWSNPFIITSCCFTWEIKWTYSFISFAEKESATISSTNSLNLSRVCWFHLFGCPLSLINDATISFCFWFSPRANKTELLLRYWPTKGTPCIPITFASLIHFGFLIPERFNASFIISSETSYTIACSTVFPQGVLYDSTYFLVSFPDGSISVSTSIKWNRSSLYVFSSEVPIRLLGIV